MQALLFNAGELSFALRARDVVQVVPRQRLQPVASAPAAIVGLLGFRGRLAPVVDLCRLTLGRDAAPRRSSRIIMTRVRRGDRSRTIGLLAENVMDLCALEYTTPGLRLPEHPWLGEHLSNHPKAPQLLDASALLPDALEAMVLPDADR